MEVTQEARLTNKEVFGYAFYSLASLFGNMTFAFRAMFYTNIGMNLAMFTTALMIARVADFFITLAVGGIIEKSNLKFGGGGKYRPWLFICQFTIVAGLILTFFDIVPGNDAVRFATLVVASILVSSSMSFIMTCQFGIVPQMAGASTVDRVKLTTWNYRLMTLGTVFTSMLSAYVVTWVGLVIPPPMNYTVTTAAFSVFYFLGIFVLRKTAKPYDVRAELKPGGMAPPQVKIGDMVKAVATNSQLLIYLLANTLSFTGMMIMMNIVIYYWQLIVPFTHGVDLGVSFPGLYTIGQTITTIMSFIFSLFAPILGNKLGKVRAMWVGLLLTALSGGLNFFFGAGVWALYVGISMIGTFAGALFAGFGVNYALDCGEYGLWKTGQDHRLVIMSMTNMPMKIAGIIGMFALYALAAIGFDSSQVPAALASNTLPAFLTDEFVTGYMFLLVGVSAILNFIAAFLMIFLYKIKDEDAVRYAKENQERMQAAGGGMPGGPGAGAPKPAAEEA